MRLSPALASWFVCALFLAVTIRADDAAPTTLDSAPTKTSDQTQDDSKESDRAQPHEALKISTDTPARGDADVPKPKQPSTKFELAPITRAFNRRNLIDFYNEHGQHDPQWDPQVEHFLEQYIEYVVDLPTAPSADDVCQQIRSIIRAGCGDPVVLCCGKLLGLTPSHDSHDPWQMATVMKQQGYPAPLVAYAASCAARSKIADDDLYDQATSLAVEQAGEVLKGNRMKPGEQRAAFAWLENIFFGCNPSKVWPNTDQQVEALLLDPNVDPWMVRVFAGRYYVNQAWMARGTGWANTVTPEGWKLFHEYLSKAAVQLRAAYGLKPECPEAATAMLAVVGGLGESDGENLETWFQRAIAGQLDYVGAYNAMYNFARPRWGGSYAAMERVGRAGLDTGRFDTWAPFNYFRALDQIASDSGDGRYCLFFRDYVPPLYPQLKRMFEGYEHSEEMKPRRGLLQSLHVVTAWRVGEYEDALATLQKMNDTLEPQARKYAYSTLPVVVQEVHARGGSAGALVTSAEEKIAHEQWDDATELLKQAAAKVPDDSHALAHIHRLALAVDLFKALQAGDWVDLTFDEQMLGWEPKRGQWKRQDDRTVIGRGHNGNFMLMLLAPLGHRFEFQCEVEIPQRVNDLDNAGAAYCIADFPVAQMRSYLLFPSPEKKQVAICRGYDKGNAQLEEVLPDNNTFQVTVWDTSFVLRLNGQVIERDDWINVSNESYGESEYVGLCGRCSYEGPEVVFRNPRARLLHNPPDDLKEVSASSP